MNQQVPVTEGQLCSERQPALLCTTLALSVSPALTQYPKCQPLAKKLGYFPTENFEPIFILRRRWLKCISHQHLKPFDTVSPQRARQFQRLTLRAQLIRSSSLVTIYSPLLAGT